MKHAGVYIHIPFCRARCSYCDFSTGAYEKERAARYVRAVAAEIQNFSLAANDIEVDTIYFGGGTPSLLAPAQIAELFEAVQSRFRVAGTAEVTMEIDPGTMARAELEECRALGVNRASFGAQTFDTEELRRLARAHTAEDAHRTLEDLRAAGFDNISLDLIAGLPAQTLEAWSANLNEALTLGPDHFSLYLLEVHEATPLAAQLRRGKWPEPDPDTAGEMYRLTTERMLAAGYEHYEISNFCQPGYESRHNMKYWTGAPYYGFGCSAHSYNGERLRWSNERSIMAYVKAIEQRGGAVVETVELSEHERQAEALYLGLRLLGCGVNLKEHQAKFGQNVRREHQEDLEQLTEAGLIELSDDRLRLTSTGALLSNEVFERFI